MRKTGPCSHRGRPAARWLRALAALLTAPLLACQAQGDRTTPQGDAPAGEWAVETASLKLRIQDEPWQMQFHDANGQLLLSEHGGTGPGPTGSLGFHLGAPPQGDGLLPLLTPLVMGEPSTPPARSVGWVHATQVLDSVRDGNSYAATLATTHPAYTLEVRIGPADHGSIAVRATPSTAAGIQAFGIAFTATEGEQYFGFGERGNAVGQRGQDLEHYVGEGPYQDEEYGPIMAVVPKWGIRWRQDATYFPMPWLLSSRGYGVLIDQDALSYHRLGTDAADAWSMEVEKPALEFRVFGDATPAGVVGRMSAALGRQPDNFAPWFLGPWMQADSIQRHAELLERDVPTSVAATYLHYLPCGSQQGIEEEQRERTQALNALGLAVHTYVNPMICQSYTAEFDPAEAEGALIQDRFGQTYIYPYTTTTVFMVSQFDFSVAQGVAAYKRITDQALAHGYEGWMEDFGEYTPLDAVARSDGATGTEFHNRYAREYHCGVAAATADAGKPLARFARSGWTGSAACSPIVWGGDPTTGFGFDGLESSIYQALSMGTSGVGLWGSDIGGFFALGFNALSDELLDRWIAFGALSVIMRSQKDGIAIPDKTRPQPWDEQHIDLWRKFAKLHTQLYPYLKRAVDTYYRTGMPVMRHHVLTHPQDAEALTRDDQYMLGDDILVAPVHTEGATQRSLYLPHGEWVNFWQAVTYSPDTGAFERVGEVERLAGGQSITVDAPIDQIPMFVRAGARIPMLPAEVMTLAEHGDNPAIIRLSDRQAAIRELRF